MRYSISYDLMKPGKNYDSLWDALKAIGAERWLASQWTVIRYNTTPLGLAEYLAQHMDANDRLLVSEMPDNYAHMNLMNRSKAA